MKIYSLLPKSRIKKHEQKRLGLPWRKVRDSVEVKLFEQDDVTKVASWKDRKPLCAAMRPIYSAPDCRGS